MLKFAEIVVFPSKKVLLLDQVPQILRNKFYRDTSHNVCLYSAPTDVGNQLRKKTL